MASHLVQRGMRAGGAATVVTACSWIWERNTSMGTSRISSRMFQGLAPRSQLTTFRPAVREFTAKAPEPAAVPLPPVVEAPKKSKSFVDWYEGHLEASPLPTKMVTGGILWGIGDAVAQVVPYVAFGDKVDGEAAAPKQFVYDWARTGRAVFFGFALHAPTAHVHYNFLEWLTVRSGITGYYIPFFKAFMEQFVYWSWLSNTLYHGAMGAMQGMTPPQIYDRIADVLWDTQKAQWVFWIPVQLLNFQFVPVRHQLNVVLVTSIVWTALLSMWYPPVEEEKDVKKAE